MGDADFQTTNEEENSSQADPASERANTSVAGAASRTPSQAPSPCVSCARRGRTPAPRPACQIVSQTVAAVPTNRTRTRVGVGEEITLTFSSGNAAWTTTGGTLSVTNGASVTFTAPDRAATVSITATGGGCTANIQFHVIEPSGVVMKKVGGTWHDHGIPSVGMHTKIYITPATVSFENIEISEDDCTGRVTGYFVGTTLDGIHHAGHGAGTWVTVGAVTARLGSEVDGQDTAQSGHCNFGTPYKNGTFDWPIPWKFRVGSGADKVFHTVHQRFTIDAAGGMTVSKAGATTHAARNHASSTY